jgi:hypothetical protein
MVGYDYFELTRQVPTIAICNRRYVVNVIMPRATPVKLDPEAACPRFRHPPPSPFTPKPGEQFAEQRIVAPGPKMRTAATFAPDTPRSGLTTTRAPDLPWWRRLLPMFGGMPGR